MEFNGRVALVTGATSGIGRMVAVKLAHEGAHVLVSGRSVARGQRVVEFIRTNRGRADLLTAKLGTEEFARSLAHRAEAVSNGGVDILINCAGVGVVASTAETTTEMFDSIFDINVRTTFFLVAELAPRMAARGRGAVVNVSTMSAGLGIPDSAAYGASKAAVGLLTKAWASEFGPRGVRVNAVAPGHTATRGTERMKGLDGLASKTPVGRPATPDEVADAIVYLAGDRASYVQGAILPVDGGRSAL
ncbi:SDR family NAD(P)-dependent oxidoreductase [Streptomyces sp. NBC_01497]|uniref:SDR family NAD(P)-dependent oxidoreductase n=1 Tax=Streptomyces sp. NBC_01497 TaxID=2903885 RepID=UPI002E2F5436|nr:SDR family oxidoreductase [Streptomyces sp. NBC_01497]